MTLTTSEPPKYDTKSRIPRDPMVDKLDKNAAISLIKGLCKDWNKEYEKVLNLPSAINFDRTEHFMIFSSGSVFPAKIISSFEKGIIEDGYALIINDSTNSTYLIISDSSRGLLFRMPVGNIHSSQKSWKEIITALERIQREGKKIIFDNGSIREMK